MSKADANKQKKDEVLRAKDIVPPYNRKIRQQQKQSTQKPTPQLTGDKINHIQTPSSEPEDTAQKEAGIPRFNLVDQIMSEQRKVASIKRKGPGKNKEANHTSKARLMDSIMKPPLILLQQEKIIAEIVARDIQKLHRGNI